MSQITTHVLDTAIGRPAEGIAVTLEIEKPIAVWVELARGVTGRDGRVRDLLPPDSLAEGVYRLTFETGQYLGSQKQALFYPRVVIIFDVRDRTQHYHIPLLLSPHGYTTYRGS